MTNRVLLAVAGGRKTQRIIDWCGDLPASATPLILTYTETSQRDLRQRLLEAKVCCKTTVIGWYSFLMEYFVRPYLPSLPGLFSFDHPVSGVFLENGPVAWNLTGRKRYFTNDGQAKTSTLDELVRNKILMAEEIDPLGRLGSMHSHIFVDEAQDLSGGDLDILETLFSAMDCITLVADPRQSVLSTNRSSQKNKASAGLGLREWAACLPSVSLEDSRETWRFGADIAVFSDRVLDPRHGYSATLSNRYSPLSIHEGVFTVALSDAPAYLQAFPDAVELRAERRQAVVNSDTAINFGLSKGLTFERTVVYVQKTVQTFLHQCAWDSARGMGSTVKELAPKTASNFYVAITRAEKSVALVLLDEVVDAVPLPRWIPVD